jgi:hypothetical protein
MNFLIFGEFLRCVARSCASLACRIRYIKLVQKKALVKLVVNIYYIDLNYYRKDKF